ncbi:MAG: hypothetical protein GJ680_05295 [Alteromonadaceae bacterium]|nr:hypothetical protein [Alteromonadaceae bacterium]
MDKVFKLKQRLQQIADSLKTNPNGLGLLGLGSAGKEIERMDEYSDLDFFAIVAEGYKQAFIDDLSWLSDLHDIAWCFKNTVDGYKLLFSDGVFCEFAVFEPNELAHIEYSEGQFVWRDASVNETLKVPLKQSNSFNTDEAYLLGELLSNLYVGLCRMKRGELISATRFIQVYALDRLINLLDLRFPGAQSHLTDKFCLDRRVEQRHPQLQPLLLECSQGAAGNIESARAMLTYVCEHYCVNADLEAEIKALL